MRRHPRTAVIACIACTVVLALTAGLGGCADDAPVTVSREALGTIVTITAYGDDEAQVTAAIDGAFAAIAAVEAGLDAYDPGSAVSAFNQTPYEERDLPADALTVLDAVGRLGVGDAFSSALLGVVRQYSFDSSGTVPDAARLAWAVEAAASFQRVGDGGRFAEETLSIPACDVESYPGLDFGGAAKGLALDRAREALRESGGVAAAIITAGSTTVTLGTKPDGGVWRIGVEDPRDTGRVVAVFALEGEGALSTSGDYQRYFEADGVRYHHILDPASGAPAYGLRSITVAGTSLSGLDSDILSTALFVRGETDALRYADAHGCALYLVDDEGRARIAPAPDGSGVTVAEEAAPRR